MQTIKILSVNTSKKKGTVKKPVPSIQLGENGIEGDAHSGQWNRQVSLLGTESIEKFRLEAKREIAFGEFAENITTSGMELWKTLPLDRFVSPHITLEVTQIGKECHGDKCAIFKEVGNCVMPKEGIFCRVITGGELQPGIIFEYHPKVFRVHVITLSDRASRGEYEDLSGPMVGESLNSFFGLTGYQHNTQYHLIPDDPGILSSLLQKCRADKADLVITTGGTGIGPRDITPDVIKPLLDKEIPGIMDMIRLKTGTNKPNALISRSIAGVMDQTIIFAIPGSVKAVKEYMPELSPFLMHLFYMLQGLDIH
jgi:molybdopterin adenylyltransferase